MKRLFLTALLSLAAFTAQAASPSFDEVYSILKTNLAGVSDKDLQAAAVEGLLGKLGNRAVLVTNAAKAGESEVKPRPAVTASSVFDSAYGYVRLGDVNKGADKSVGEAMHLLASTNQLKGFILDLRFARGDDHQDIFKVADCFFPADKTIASMGGRTERSTGRSALPQVPMVILVNKKSQDAVEVLAASLRAAKVGLLLGSQTAGELSLYKDIPLTTGQILRVATGEITFDDGSTMPFDGVKPDIKVDVSLLDEQMYLADAYKVIGGSATNKTTAATPPGRLINEAELVRRHREGLNPDVEIVPAKPEEATGKVVRDPALARALDLVKGLSMVRDYRGKK